MKLWQRWWARVPQPDSKRQLIVVAALLLLLPLLAALQFHWVGQVSEGEREFMKANLRNSAEHFSRDFDQELTRLYAAFQEERFGPEALTQTGTARYAAKFAQWQRQTAHPRLVSTILFTQSLAVPPPAFGDLQWQCLNASATDFSNCVWPPAYQDLRATLEERFENLRRALAGQEPLIPRPFPEALAGAAPALAFPLLQRSPGPAFFTATRQSRNSASPERMRPLLFSGLLIVALDQRYLRETYLPALIQQHFNQDRADYDIVITSRGNSPEVFYTSAAPAGKGQATLLQADVTTELFSIRMDFLRALLRERWRARQPLPQPAVRANTAQPPPLAMPLRGDEEGGQWQLLIQHRAGSLAAAVATARRRNLLLSFGILILLTTSFLLLLSSARRAARLAQLQMDFVAGVSHELRTPISVIDAAGYNLMKGHIKDAAQMNRYGTLIRQESRRLTEMVEQILEFAGAQAKRQQYDLQPTDLKQIIEEALASPLLTEHSFAVEKELPAALPTVQADAAALRRVLQNLVSNAVKYSGEQRWLQLQAQTDQTGNHVQITIRDRGLGIPAAELPHVFEPFYRGSEARAAQIHGNGLGLSLVKNIIEAHGGQISVTSVIGHGSAFTLRLPVDSV
jgi:signal transduction histidine kinase